MINSFNNLSLQQKEDLIQPLLENIANNNKKDIAFFFELFSDDIYNFPIKYFSFNEDDAGDFYLYAYEHLKNGKKIASFKYKSKFTTWFFSVLRNLVIDYLRKNKNKLSFLPFNKLDSNGNAIDLVDNIPDNVEQEKLTYDEDILNKFIIKLNTMKTYNRVLFKLAFIHYIDLNEDEIDWLCQTNEIKKNQILEILKKLKETGFEKSNEVRKIEDKLTMNFQSINYLENKINNFFKDNPSFRPDRHIWSEHYENSKLPADITRYIQMLFKKKKRHVFLLQNQKKSLLCTRLPYKTFAYLLHATEGVLSVQLLRIIEKLSQEV